MTLVAPKQPHRSHRKRSGQHQHKHKNFGKAYWPYLPLLLVVGLGFWANNLWPSQRNVLGYATGMTVTELLKDTNEQRIHNGERILSLDSRLTAAAQRKASDMASKDYWSHNTPSGQTPWSFITASGYKYRTAGENLAYGFDTSAATMTGWMNSPEHRANILNESYRNIGFGIVDIPNYQGEGPETLVVAMYASPATASGSQNTTVNTNALEQSTPVTAGTSLPKNSDTLTPGAERQQNEQPTQSVTRLQLVANGEAAWSVMTVFVIITVAFALLIVRHGYAWHKLLNKGERFALAHPLLDVAAVSIITLGVILTRSAGFIK